MKEVPTKNSLKEFLKMEELSYRNQQVVCQKTVSFCLSNTTMVIMVNHVLQSNGYILFNPRSFNILYSHVFI